MALFYGVACTRPFVVPVPLATCQDASLWDFKAWMSTDDERSVCNRSFILEHAGKRIHCILIFSAQLGLAAAFRNQILSEPGREWRGNVLIVWANNGWPRQLEPDVALVASELHKGDNAVQRT